MGYSVEIHQSIIDRMSSLGVEDYFTTTPLQEEDTSWQLYLNPSDERELSRVLSEGFQDLTCDRVNNLAAFIDFDDTAHLEIVSCASVELIAAAWVRTMLSLEDFMESEEGLEVRVTTSQKLPLGRTSGNLGNPASPEEKTLMLVQREATLVLEKLFLAYLLDEATLPTVTSKPLDRMRMELLLTFLRPTVGTSVLLRESMNQTVRVVKENWAEIEISSGDILETSI